MRFLLIWLGVVAVLAVFVTLVVWQPVVVLALGLLGFTLLIAAAIKDVCFDAY